MPLPFSLPSALRKPGHRTFTYEVTRHARRTRPRSAARRKRRVRCNGWFGGLQATKKLVSLYVGFSDDLRPALDVGPYKVLCVAYAHGDRLET